MIFAIGEVLIDFIAVEEGPLKGVASFEKHPGGAPANVLVGLSRLGVGSALISKVGDDPFGAFLLEELRREGVDTSHVAVDGEKHTGVVFVQLMGAKPEFILYDGVAYFNLKPEDVDVSLLEKAEGVHFGSVLFAREPSRSTLFRVLKELKGKIPLSYDVNVRPDLWRGREEPLKDIERALELADIVKIGDEELEFLERNGVDVLDFDFRLLAITRGGKGSELVHEGIKVEVPAYRVEPVDTTGAGDAFMAALLASLNHTGKMGNFELDEGELYRMGRFANLVAALSTLKRGAWSVPKLEEIKSMEEVEEIYQRSRR
ncbi:sugar kinase [Thermococcus sp. P6]|uniref:carbohydrate kinase family protein n=1 Tax=Thermococcus sp. P6 TaxID=122420 RepID=UPI000B59AB7C|nr:carbohydrate kinase [Thermococcus sp. P6]ASJ10067.1 sugar kinase [Thermococcus sp. P6]